MVTRIGLTLRPSALNLQWIHLLLVGGSMGRRRVVSPVPVKSPRDGLRDVKKQRERAQERAPELHEQGMPFQMALAVAHGRLELNEALERMARNDRILRLMKKHDLSRALATQVALGQADLDRVLYTRRFDDHRKDNRVRSVLDEAKENGSSVVLGLHGRTELEAKITGSDTYSVIAAPEGQDPRDVHKLQVKYAYRPDDARKVAKARNRRSSNGLPRRVGAAWAKDLTPTFPLKLRKWT